MWVLWIWWLWWWWWGWLILGMGFVDLVAAVEVVVDFGCQFRGFGGCGGGEG